MELLIEETESGIVANANARVCRWGEFECRSLLSHMVVSIRLCKLIVQPFHLNHFLINAVASFSIRQVLVQYFVSMPYYS